MNGTWENGNFVLASTKNDEIQRLRSKVAELEAWKSAAIQLENEWDCQTVAKALNIQVGQSIRANILPKITELQAENQRLREALAKHGRHMADCAFLPNWIESHCNCGLREALTTPAQSLKEHDDNSTRTI